MFLNKEEVSFRRNEDLIIEFIFKIRYMGEIDMILNNEMPIQHIYHNVYDL